jgi:hypothetical protein
MLRIFLPWFFFPVLSARGRWRRRALFIGGGGAYEVVLEGGSESDGLEGFMLNE